MSNRVTIWQTLACWVPILAWLVIILLKAHLSNSVWPDRAMDTFAFLMAAGLGLAIYEDYKHMARCTDREHRAFCMRHEPS